MVTVFFVPYALLEVPSNIVLKLWRPSIWIAVLMFCWGLVMTLMGIVQSYGGLVAARFFLGVAEVRTYNAGSIDSMLRMSPEWILPCGHLPAHNLVSTLRGPEAYGRLLHSRITVRRFLGSPRLREFELLFGLTKATHARPSID